MLLLGVLAAQAEGAAPSPVDDVYDLLETEILTGSQASVIFSSLNSTYGADYQHLQLRIAAQGTTGNANIGFTFNGDTSNNYAWHALLGTGSAVESDSSVNRGNIIGSIAVVASSNTNQFNGSVIDILDAFNTSKYKTTRSLSGRASGGGNLIQLDSGLWRSTDALSSMTFTITTGNINIGSRFSLYGLRSA
jgi:hypothetical protein